MSTKTNLWLFASLLLFGVGAWMLYKQEFAYGFLAVYSSLACLRVHQKSRLADRLREIRHNTQMQLMCELTAHLPESELQLLEPVLLEAGVAYRGNITVLHESIPLPQTRARSMARINVPGIPWFV